tara:strand:- start:1800 stop:2054 length:255 start_codon:yes stop_codon:yes gene_type:complete
MESFEFKLFSDSMKRQFLLQQMFQAEVELFSLSIDSYDPGHPDYDEWKYSLDTTINNIQTLRSKYEELGGEYEMSELKNVVNNS